MTENGELMVDVGRRDGRKISLKHVAMQQRWLQRATAMLYASVFAFLYVLILLRAPSLAGVRPLMSLAFGSVILASSLGVVVAAARLMIAMGRNAWLARALALAMLIPFLGLLIIASADTTASVMLKSRGVRVGLLGVPRSELHKLVHGECSNCGYDVRAIEHKVCPECGAELPEDRRAPAEVAGVKRPDSYLGILLAILAMLILIVLLPTIGR